MDEKTRDIITTIEIIIDIICAVLNCIVTAIALCGDNRVMPEYHYKSFYKYFNSPTKLVTNSNISKKKMTGDFAAASHKT